MEQAVKTTIRPNIANMTKTVGGSYHKPDFIGDTLAGITVAQVLLVAIAVGLDADKYKHLNPGQQRMTLGNSLRKMTNVLEVPEVDGKPDQKVVDKNEEIFAIREKIEEMADDFRAANDDAKKAKADEKAAIAAEKAAAKAAATSAKAKAAAPTESEGGEV